MVSFNPSTNTNMVGLGLIFLLLSLAFTAETKSSTPTSPSETVSVGYHHLNETSSSVLMAESWVRAHVLAHYPSLRISTINVGDRVLCSNGSEDAWDLVLPSMKNIYHSLVRWGLHKDIKVTTYLSIECYREELVYSIINPLFHFLQHINSSFYYMNHPSLSYGAINKFGSSETNSAAPAHYSRPKSRKLSFLSSNGANPPLSSPMFTFPFAPQSSATQPPSMPFSYAPQSPSDVPYPPCYAPMPTPSAGEETGLWCVAKPNVPEEKLQEAMDYACGAGGADCEEIGVHGSCYHPDTVIAHASYAFNSYWQKNRKIGGTCSFGGTAIVINANPSFEHCRFILG